MQGAEANIAGKKLVLGFRGNLSAENSGRLVYLYRVRKKYQKH
jgi:hypothetical protein